MKPYLCQLVTVYRNHNILITASFLQAFAAVVGYFVNLLCLRTIGPVSFGDIALYTSVGGIYAILLNFGDEYLFINKTPSHRFYFRLIWSRIALIVGPAILITLIAHPLAAVSFAVFASHAVISRHYIEARNAQVEEVAIIALLRLPLAAAALMVGNSYVAMAVFFASASLPVVPRVTAFVRHRMVPLPEQQAVGQVAYLLSASAMAAPILTGLIPRVVLGFAFGSRVLADVYVVHQLSQPFLIVINSIVSIYRQRFGLGIRSRFALFSIAIAIGLGLLQVAIFPALHVAGIAEAIFGFEPSPYVWFLGTGLILYPIAHAFVMFSRKLDIIVVNVVVGGVGAAAICFLASSIEQSLAILTLMPIVASCLLLYFGALRMSDQNI